MKYKDTIEVTGEYKSSSQTSRFHVKCIKVNGLAKPAEFNKPYTKTEFMKLLGQMWKKIIMMSRRVKVTIIIEEI